MPTPLPRFIVETAFSVCLHESVSEFANISHIRPRVEGGGSDAWMTKFTAAIQKPLMLCCPNFVTFSFVFNKFSDQILAKLIYQGVATTLFLSRHLKNVENEKVFSA